jgi:8-hydroxy-5-deazaflavin:NADPH oxidoreductase
MSSLSFIGLRGMARAIAARAVAGGNAVELIGCDAAKAKGLAAALGGGATAGTFGNALAGVACAGARKWLGSPDL